MKITPSPYQGRINDYPKGYAVWPYTALAFSMLCFASNYIIGRTISGEMPPIGLSFWRWVVAALVILPFTWRRLLKYTPLIKTNLRLFLQLTVALVLLGNTTIYIALNYTTAINAGIVATSEPAVTILLTWLFFKETVTKIQTLGALIAGVGVMMIIMRGDLLALADITFNLGDLWMVASVFGFASYAAFLRKSPKELPPLVLINIIQLLGILVLLPFYLWETNYIMPMRPNPSTIITVLWLGIIVAAVGFGLWNVGIQTVGANKASTFIYVRLLLVTVLAIMILDEDLKIYHLPAFVFIIIGVYMVSKAKRQN